MECECGVTNEVGVRFCAGCGHKVTGKAEGTHSNHLELPDSSLGRSSSFGGSMDDLGTPGGSFWDVGNYKTTLKRIGTGAKLCDELVKLLQERAAVEKHYAKELTQWSERWQDKAEKMGEYGTLLDGWRSVLYAARQIADIHESMKERLNGVIKEQIDQFKVTHYAKGFIHYKTYKRASNAFSKGQIPWAKRKAKIVKYQKAQHLHQEAAAKLRQDAQSGTLEAKKAETSARKEDREAALIRAKLAQRIDEMHKYKDIYEREMSLEFHACQEEERTRIEFFKKTLQDYCGLVDVVAREQEIHMSLRGNLARVNADKDLDQFAREHGALMPIHLPDANGDFTIACPPGQASRAPDTSHLLVPIPDYNSSAAQDQGQSFPPAPSPPKENKGRVYGINSKKMRTLYDYDAQNHDELSFRFDDVVMITEPDRPVGVR